MQNKTYLSVTCTKYKLQDCMKFSTRLTDQINTVSPIALDTDLV